MSNPKKLFRCLLLLASIGACKATVGSDNPDAREADEQFVDAETFEVGECPESIGALGALPESQAIVVSNAVSIHHKLEEKVFLAFEFTRIENTRDLQATTYNLTTTKTVNQCFENPAPAECAASVVFAANGHILSATAGTLTVTRAEIEGLGRVVGSFANLQLAEIDVATGKEFVPGGCSMTIASGTFDDDLTTLGPPPA